MKTDIWISEVNGQRKMQIPWLPNTIKIEGNRTRFAEYDIMDKGEVYVPNGANLKGYSFSSNLPGEGHRDLPFLRGRWEDPKNYQKVWNEWKDKGTLLRLLITGTPINADVYLADFTVEYGGGAGDYAYTLEFIDYQKLEISSKKVENAAGSGDGKRAASKAKTYTVKSGDCLWKIAKAKLGAGSRWKEIYNLNKEIIESTAKKHGKKNSNSGHWIWPNTVLSLPEK